MKKLALIIGFLGLFACGGSSRNEWSAVTITSFLNSCEVNSSAKYCTCTLGKLQETYTEAQIVAINSQIAAGGAVPNGLIDAANACAGL